MNAVALEHRRAGAGPLPFIALGGLLFLTVLATALGNGNPLVAIAPMALVGLLLALVKLPLRVSALAVLFLMLTADYLPELPFSFLWRSPLAPLGELLFLNLSAVTGIGFLRFPGLDVLVFLLLVVGVLRRAVGSTIDPKPTPSVRVLNLVLLAMFGTVLWLEAMGIFTGGDFNESLWQIRQLLLFPFMTLLFLHAFSGTKADFLSIARVMIVAGLVKSLLGIYFAKIILPPLGKVVEFTTSHSDTLLFVPLIAGAFAFFMEQPRKRTLRSLLKWLPIVFYGMILNDRRIAYVSLGAGIFTIYQLQPRTRIKRRIAQTLVVLSPLLIAYVAAGWNSNNPVFSGAQLVKSLIKGDQAQAGADYRDIENFDLLATWSNNPFLGSGFGHKFDEPVKLPDISFVMSTYQYHPHDAILWLWGVGGVLGFTGLFLPFVAGVFLAARAFRKSTDPFDRAMAMTIICFVIAHINQCFGDMGTRNYFGSMLGALAVAMASKLAVRTGAWPPPAKERAR